MYDEELMQEAATAQMILVDIVWESPTHWRDILMRLVESEDMDPEHAMTVIMTGLQAGALDWDRRRPGFLVFAARHEDESLLDVKMRILSVSENLKRLVRNRDEEKPE